MASRTTTTMINDASTCSTPPTIASSSSAITAAVAGVRFVFTAVMAARASVARALYVQTKELTKERTTVAIRRRAMSASRVIASQTLEWSIRLERWWLRCPPTCKSSTEEFEMAHLPLTTPIATTTTVPAESTTITTTTMIRQPAVARGARILSFPHYFPSQLDLDYNSAHHDEQPDTTSSITAIRPQQHVSVVQEEDDDGTDTIDDDDWEQVVAFSPYFTTILSRLPPPIPPPPAQFLFQDYDVADDDGNESHEQDSFCLPPPIAPTHMPVTTRIDRITTTSSYTTLAQASDVVIVDAGWALCS